MCSVCENTIVCEFFLWFELQEMDSKAACSVPGLFISFLLVVNHIHPFPCLYILYEIRGLCNTNVLNSIVHCPHCQLQWFNHFGCACGEHSTCVQVCVCLCICIQWSAHTNTHTHTHMCIHPSNRCPPVHICVVVCTSGILDLDVLWSIFPCQCVNCISNRSPLYYIRSL